MPSLFHTSKRPRRRPSEAGIASRADRCEVSAWI
jgi:hypothetical protein